MNRLNRNRTGQHLQTDVDGENDKSRQVVRFQSRTESNRLKIDHWATIVGTYPLDNHVRLAQYPKERVDVPKHMNFFFIKRTKEDPRNSSYS